VKKIKNETIKVTNNPGVYIFATEKYHCFLIATFACFDYAIEFSAKIYQEWESAGSDGYIITIVKN